MQTVDRAGFMAWLDGVYLSFEKGKGIIAPEIDCIAAEEALERYERVALTVKGRIVSYLIPDSEQVREIAA